MQIAGANVVRPMPELRITVGASFSGITTSQINDAATRAPEVQLEVVWRRSPHPHRNFEPGPSMFWQAHNLKAAVEIPLTAINFPRF